MLSCGTLSIAAGTTVTDVASVLLGLNPGLLTPAHFVKIQNNGSGTIRIGEASGVQGGLGFKLGPGEDFEIRVDTGDRVGIVGNSNLAASGIDVICGTV